MTTPDGSSIPPRSGENSASDAAAEVELHHYLQRLHQAEPRDFSAEILATLKELQQADGTERRAESVASKSGLQWEELDSIVRDAHRPLHPGDQSVESALRESVAPALSGSKQSASIHSINLQWARSAAILLLVASGFALLLAYSGERGASSDLGARHADEDSRPDGLDSLLAPELSGEGTKKGDSDALHDRKKGKERGLGTDGVIETTMPRTPGVTFDLTRVESVEDLKAFGESSLRMTCVLGEPGLLNQALNQAPHLKMLSLDFQRSTELPANELAPLKGYLSVEVLTLSRADPEALREIPEMSSVQSLNIENTDVALSADLLAQRFPAIHSIAFLSSPESAQSMVTSLDQFSNLTALQLSGNKLGDLGLDAVRLPDLESLMVAHEAQLTDQAIAGLTRFQHLKLLHIINCPNVTRSGLAALKQQLGNDCQIILSAKAFSTLPGQNVPRGEASRSFPSVLIRSPDEVKGLAGMLPFIRVRLGAPDTLEGDAVAIVHALVGSPVRSGIRVLDLSIPNALKASHIAELLEHCPQLEELQLNSLVVERRDGYTMETVSSQLTWVNDAVLKAVAESTLERLCVQGQLGVTRAGVEHLLEQGSLSFIDLTGCLSLNAQDLAELRSQFAGVEIVWLDPIGVDMHVPEEAEGEDE